MFFRISWDERFPYECRAMNFKSKVIPHIEVYKLDGVRCLSFVDKLGVKVDQSDETPVIKRKRKRKVNIVA
jgi:hypothetical protein